MLSLDLPAVCDRGVDAVAAEAVARLAGRGLDGFWLHLDADVLDDEIMPVQVRPLSVTVVNRSAY